MTGFGSGAGFGGAGFTGGGGLADDASVVAASDVAGAEGPGVALYVGGVVTPLVSNGASLLYWVAGLFGGWMEAAVGAAVVVGAALDETTTDELGAVLEAAALLDAELSLKLTAELDAAAEPSRVSCRLLVGGVVGR